MMNIEKRPLLFLAILFIIGIILGFYLTLSYLILLLFILSIIFLLIIYKNKVKLILFVFVIILGFFCINFYQLQYTSEYAISQYNEQGRKEIIAEVREDMAALEGNQILLQPYFVADEKVKYGLIQLDRRYLPLDLENGDLISINLSLRTPHKKRNPGGFSSYNFLKKQGILSWGYYNENLTIIGQRKQFKNILINFKKRALYLIDNIFSSPYNQVIKALLLGERDNLPSTWQDNFTKAGANHLLAISGLHVGFVMLIFLTVLKLIKLPLGISNLIITMLLLFYIMLTGLRPSVLRASLLSLLFLWASYFNRKGDFLNLLGFTAIINLLINPFDLFTVGFQLSYLVLIMIIIWQKFLIKYFHPLIAVAIAAQLGSMPLTAYYFNQIVPIGIITNIWAIPLVGVIVSISLLALIMGLIHPVFLYVVARVISILLLILNQGTNLMTKIPLAYWEVATPHFLTLILIYLFLFILPWLLQEKITPFNQMKRKKRLYITGIITLLIIFIYILLPFWQKDYLEIIFFDVGQGDAILLNLPNKRHIIVDTGDQIGQNSRLERDILPYLKQEGIKKIDLVFITHFHYDHAYGLLDLLKKRDLALIVFPYGYQPNYLSERIREKADYKNVPIVKVREGDLFQLQDIEIKILNPADYLPYISRNENSIVFKLTYQDFSILLTGDLEVEGEMRLSELSYTLESDILKLSHHGSNTSSIKEFLQKVTPKEAIISVGANNLYGHPAEEVLTRVKNKGIRIWRTDKHGAVIIKSDGTDYSIRSYLN